MVDNVEHEVPEQTIQTEEGTVKISEEVVSIIAGLAVSEVKGVAGMSGGIVGGIAEFVGKKNPSRGIKVQVSRGGRFRDYRVRDENSGSCPRDPA